MKSWFKIKILVNTSAPSSNRVHLSQRQFNKNLLKEFGMDTCKALLNPVKLHEGLWRWGSWKYQKSTAASLDAFFTLIFYSLRLLNPWVLHYLQTLKYQTSFSLISQKEMLWFFCIGECFHSERPPGGLAFLTGTNPVCWTNQVWNWTSQAMFTY